MSQPGAPIGNQNGRKGKAWADALRKALIQFESEKVQQGAALQKIAETVVLRAIAGDKDAWQEIGNRLDGKPAQSVEVEGGDSPVKLSIGWMKSE